MCIAIVTTVQAGSLIGKQVGSLIGKQAGSLIGMQAGFLVGKQAGSLIGKQDGFLICRQAGSRKMELESNFQKNLKNSLIKFSWDLDGCARWRKVTIAVAIQFNWGLIFEIMLRVGE